MHAHDAADDAAQAEGEGPDGADCKPPSRSTPHQNANVSSTTNATTATKNGSPAHAKLPPPQARPQINTLAAINGKAGLAAPATPATPAPQPSNVPLPPKDYSSFPKQPGTTRRDLETLSRSPPPASAMPLPAPAAPPPPPVSRTSSLSGSSSSGRHGADSDSESEAFSPPPTRPPTQPPSRANSTSSSVRPKLPWNLSGKNKDKDKDKDARPSPAPSAYGSAPRSPHPDHPPPSPALSATGRPSRPPSLRSDDGGGGGQKFTLKDLLASGPKLARRSSQKSAGGSSRKSNSEDGKSTGGESSQSLLKKYGVCGKVAIGKGATSVVRLAHKWDRSEEKLYAVKVRSRSFQFTSKRR
jgi:protein-serine/threonine kinase